MAEGEKLTGMSKYFNSVTMQGRANVSVLTSKLSEDDVPLEFENLPIYRVEHVSETFHQFFRYRRPR